MKMKNNIIRFSALAAILFFCLCVILHNKCSGQTRINNVCGVALMPDGNKAIGIIERSEGIVVSVLDIRNHIEPIEIKRFSFKDSNVDTKYELATSVSGNYVAIGVRPKKSNYVTNIQIYNIDSEKLITTIDTDKLFSGCNRHSNLRTLDFSLDDKYLYFGDLHASFRYNIGNDHLKEYAFVDKIMIGYDVSHDTPIVAGGIKNREGHLCVNKKDIYTLDGNDLNKISYGSIMFSHNKLLDANVLSKYTDIKNVDKPFNKGYLVSHTSNKFLATIPHSKIIEIYVTL